MSVAPEGSEAGDGCSDVFEIVLPITIFVLSDDDFLQDDIEEQAALLPELKEEDEQEANLDNSSFLKSNVTPASEKNRLRSWEEKTTSNKHDQLKYIEEKCVARSVCDKSKSNLSSLVDQCDLSKDKYNQNDALPISPCKTELADVDETSENQGCDDDNYRFQKIPLLSPAGKEGRDKTIGAEGELTLAPASKNERPLASTASILSYGSQEKHPEIHLKMEAIAETGDIDSSKNESNEVNRARKRSKCEDEAQNFLLENELKEELKLTLNSSAVVINRFSPNSEELIKDVGTMERNALLCTESNSPTEHIYQSLTPFSRKKYRQQNAMSHASPKELQSQQEGLSWLTNNVSIKPLSKGSRSINKQGKLNLKCRFCSSVFKCTALLKKHVYAAHKDKKKYKCCFCKRTFFFSVNLKNHLKFHKKITRLQKTRKNRMNAKKRKQRKTEERKSEMKKKESKYENFFIKIERDFTMGVPVTFSCKICFFASSNPRIFIHHLKGHKERPPYQCPQCDYSCVSLSYMLNHMYWHAGYKLYKCRFCTFLSLYFTSMVRHSYIHTGAKPYSCELCQSAFTTASGLKKHRKRLHAGKETCQGQQLSECVSKRRRTQRPLKSYACDECHLVFYAMEHLNFHKKFHEQTNIYMNQSNKYCESKIYQVGSDSHDCVSLFLSEDSHPTGEMCKMMELDFKQAGGIWDNKKMCSGQKLPENSYGSSTLPATEKESKVFPESNIAGTVICKEEPLFSPEVTYSQVQDDNEEDAYHKLVENFKDTWPSSLSSFKMYKCEHCDYATSAYNSLKMHLRIHRHKKLFECKECSKTFRTSSLLQRHSHLHVKNQYEFGHYVCVDNCLEDFKLHHEGHLGMYPEMNFLSSEGLNGVHSRLSRKASGEQTEVQRSRECDLAAQSQPQFYQCSECEYTTYILSNLKLHVRTHTGEKPYSCSVCQKNFRTSSHLKRHKMLHFNMKHLKCRNCDYSTDKWLTLKQHLTSHSGNEISGGNVCEQKVPPVKTFTCEECGYSTTHNGNFKQHLRIHTGEKPFKCSQCLISFRTSGHLKRHLLTHLKLHCKRCAFSTIDRYAMRKHAKTHKVYKCKKCNVTFSTKKLFEKHKWQHLRAGT